MFPGPDGPQAIGLSLANTFGVLGFRKDFIDPNTLTALPGLLKVVSAAQTVAGIVSHPLQTLDVPGCR